MGDKTKQQWLSSTLGPDTVKKKRKEGEELGISEVCVQKYSMGWVAEKVTFEQRLGAEGVSHVALGEQPMGKQGGVTWWEGQLVVARIEISFKEC